MLYSTFIQQAKELVIQQADNEMWYLEPEWVDILHRNRLGDLEELDDSYITDWLDVEDILKLEVEKRNLMQDKKKVVIDWLYEVITANVEPAMLAEETDYIKAVTEFMRTNHEKNVDVAAQDKDNG